MRGFASLLVLGSLGAGHPAEPDVRPAETGAPEAAPGPAVPERAGLELRASSRNFRVFGHGARSWERLAETTERTRERMRSWLGLSTGDWAEPVDLLLCRDRTEVELTVRRLRLPRPQDPLRRKQRPPEGYYSTHRVIVLSAHARDMRWFVAHESCHPVFREATRATCPAINEGLAETLPSWILFSDAERPEDAGYTYLEYERHAATLVREGRVPSLEAFLELSSAEFQADRWTHFSLAWSLVRLLLTSTEEGVAGRLPGLVRALSEDESPWVTFARHYDAGRVEDLWRAELEGLARTHAK